jgi:hypothetical protein
MPLMNESEARILAMVEAMIAGRGGATPTSAAEPDETLINPAYPTPSIEGASRTPSRTPGPDRERRGRGSARGGSRSGRTASKTPGRSQWSSGTPFNEEGNEDFRNCRWTEEMEDELWRGMIEAKVDGHQSDGGFKASGWTIIFAAVNRVSGNFPLELKHVKSKYSNENRIWKLWEAYEKSCISGWTRRDDGALVNDTEVEEDYYEKNRERRRFRRKAPRYLNDMIELFADRVASGRGAISIEDALSQGPEETVEDEEEDDQNDPELGEDRDVRSRKGKKKASQSLDLRKRAASYSANPRAKKTLSSTRELAVGLFETNQTLKKLGNRVGQIIEGITPIERAMKLLRDEIPELGFRNKMNVSEKLDKGSNAAIFCSLTKEERREWVKDIVPELDALLEHENNEEIGGSENFGGIINIEDL